MDILTSSRLTVVYLKPYDPGNRATVVPICLTISDHLRIVVIAGVRLVYLAPYSTAGLGTAASEPNSVGSYEQGLSLTLPSQVAIAEMCLLSAVTVRMIQSARCRSDNLCLIS